MPITLGSVTDSVEPRTLVHPASLQCAWMVINSLPTTADNGGSSVVAPLGITRADVYRRTADGLGTILELCVRYDRARTISTALVCQPFGFDKNGVGQRLKNSAGTHELTFDDAATDFDDGVTYKYTDSQEVDLNGAFTLMVPVKTALVLSSGTNAAIMCRLK